MGAKLLIQFILYLIVKIHTLRQFCTIVVIYQQRSHLHKVGTCKTI